MQPPLEQAAEACENEQTLLQVPQLLGSKAVFVHMPPQFVCGAAQVVVQTLMMHAWPAPQA